MEVIWESLPQVFLFGFLQFLCHAAAIQIFLVAPSSAAACASELDRSMAEDFPPSVVYRAHARSSSLRRRPLGARACIWARREKVSRDFDQERRCSRASKVLFETLDHDSQFELRVFAFFARRNHSCWLLGVVAQESHPLEPKKSWNQGRESTNFWVPQNALKIAYLTERNIRSSEILVSVFASNISCAVENSVLSID